MKSWNELSMAEKADVMKLAIEGGVYDLDSIRSGYNKFVEGGDTNPGMTGMMKSKLATAAHFGNPTARRMTNYDTRSYTWPGEYEYDNGIGEPKRGNVFVGSYGNLVTPQIQDTGKGLTFVEDVWSPENDKRSFMQSLKFNNEEDAKYFGEHYKEIAPMMNLYRDGGHKIHIKPENRGKFTALKERTGHSATWFKEHGTPAQKKMATFALNARKWKHGEGGNLYDGESEETQQMQKGHAIYLNYPNAEGGLAGAVRIGGIDVGAALGKVTGITSAPWGHAGVIMVDNKGNSDYYDFGRYKAGSDEYGVSTFGAIKKGKGNWRTKKLPKQKQGENDSVYVARIQNGLPDTKFGVYQALSFPNIDIEKAKAHVVKQANDANRKAYGVGNTCVDAAYKSIVPFLQDPDVAEKVVNTSPEEYNTEGYSPFASFWSMFPWTVGYTSAAMRKIADKTYTMNKKK